jgi:hypothetical protein
MRYRHWTAAEDALLRECYAGSHNADLATVLVRTPAAVLQRALVLGLRKTPEYKAAHCHRFKPGAQPWNTGRDDFRPGGRSVETRFKPGELSGRAAALVQPIGTLRIVAGNTLQRKIADTPGPNHLRWRSVHELVWIEARGPVPRGHVVVFRAGQHTTVEAEITLDRLELVSRAELMRRNSVHRHGPEIASLSMLRGALNRQINRRQKAEQEERA